jgi:hypothetical protein
MDCGKCNAPPFGVDAGMREDGPTGGAELARLFMSRVIVRRVFSVFFPIRTSPSRFLSVNGGNNPDI